MHTIYLIRHGQSQSNAGLQTDAPGSARLTDTGRTQSELLAAHLDTAMGGAPRLVVTSPFIRTGETAGPLLAMHPDAPREVWPIQEYVILGEERYRSLPPPERARQMHALLLRGDPLEKDMGSGESWREFMARVASCLDRLANCTGDTAVFCHGLFLRAMVKGVLAGHTRDSSRAMVAFDHLWRALAFQNTAFVRLFPDPNGGGFAMGPIERPHLDGHPELVTG